MDVDPAAYIGASNVLRNGEEYVLKITKASLNKMLSPAGGGPVGLESIAVLENIERIANNGVYFDSAGDRSGRDQIAGYDHLMTTVYIDGEPYLVDMRVRVYDTQTGGENRLYYFTPEEIITTKKVGANLPTGTLHERTMIQEETPTSDTTLPQRPEGVKGQDAHTEGGLVLPGSGESGGRTVFAPSVLEGGQAARAAALNAMVRDSEAIGERGRDAFISTYDGTADSAAFYGDFMQYYNAGTSGQKLAAVQARVGDVLSRDQKYAAWASGQNDGKASLKAERAAAVPRGGESGLVRNVWSKTLDKGVADTVDGVAKALGVQVVFEESISSPDGRAGGANGRYKDGTIHIAMDAADPVLEVVKHEATHRMQELAPGAYRKYRDYAVRLAGTDAVLRMQEARLKAGEELTSEGAMDELAADLSQKLLTDRGSIDRFIREDRGTAQRFFDALKKAVQTIREKLGRAEPSLEQAERLWKDAFRAAEREAKTAQKNAASVTGGEAKYSLKAFPDGQRFVEVQTDQEQFDRLSDKEKTKLAIQIIKRRFSGKVIGIDNQVFINGRSAAEYGHPVKNIESDVRDAKMRASTELDNLIDAGTGFRTAPDGADGHIHLKTVGDFGYFDVLFKVGGEYYKGVINIEVVEKGRRLKDITKIENITQDISSSYGTNPKSTFLRDTSINSIPQSGPDSNSKYSFKEKTPSADASRLRELNEYLRRQLQVTTVGA